MKNIFKNKVVWIIGASSGIGEALAFRFNQLGSKVILSSRREDELNRVSISSPYPENNRILPLNLLELSLFREKTKVAFSLFGVIDYVFLNGGTSSRGSVSKTELNVYYKLMELNFFSYVGITKEILPFFEEQKNGHFIVTSSTMGRIGSLSRSAYASSKHALHGFYNCLRAEVAKDNIKVTVLTPGYIVTNISFNSLTVDGSPRMEMSKNIEKGLPAEKAAKQIINAVRRQKNEVYIGRKFKTEHLSLLLMRFFPNFLHKMVKRFPPN